jgi:hypothetical protein
MKLYPDPTSWQDLQISCARLLAESGYESAVEKSIQTVRSSVVVDCLARGKEVSGPVILVECKHWKTRIPQSIVKSFLTTVSEFGGNFGYIISRAGFQPAAFESAKKTNVTLLTFDEFMLRHSHEWFRFVIERNFEVGQELLPFSQFNFKPPEYENLTEEEKRIYTEIISECKKDGIDFLTMKEHYYELPKHTISVKEIDARIAEYGSRFPIEVIYYSDYFNHINQYCLDRLSQFDGLFKKKIRRNLFNF